MKRSIVSICIMLVNFFCFSLPKIGVVTFDVNDKHNYTAKTDAVAVSNIIRSTIVKSNKYEVITRESIDKLLIEQKIQTSSLASKENIAKLKLANISYLVIGNVDVLGYDYAISMSVLNVSSGKFEFSDTMMITRDAGAVFKNSVNFAEKFTMAFDPAEKARIVALPPPPPPTKPEKTYKIGDRGPGGGYVFYDKGIFSNGWRYLEAASEEFEFSAEWGAFGKNIAGTEYSVGSGKRNTNLITHVLKTVGETEKAVQRAAGITSDTYDDWFIPSKDELNLMYHNLKRKELAQFKNKDYWSSSQLSESWAWSQSFKDGQQISNQKNGLCYIRPVRAF